MTDSQFPHGRFASSSFVGRVGGEHRVSGDGGQLVSSALMERFLTRLRAAMGPESWSAWGHRLRPGDADEQTVRIYAPSQLYCERVLDRVSERRMREIWDEIDPAGRRISLSPDPRPRHFSVVPSAPPAADEEEISDELVADEERWEELPSAAQAPSRTFDTFVVGTANKIAHAIAHSIAGVEAPPAPLAVIHGAYGAGKTHLLRAAQAEANELTHHGQRALYFSADRFRLEYVKALRAQAGIEFKERVQAAEILLIDDLHMLGNSRSTQSELLHAVNEVLADGGRVLVAADRPVESLSELDDGLRARLSAAVSCAIEQPDLDLRRDILKACAAQNGYVRNGLTIPPEVLDFIASAVVAMPRDLEAAFATLITRTALIGVPVTRATATEALGDLLNGARRRITVEDIQRAVANYHGIKITDLLSKRRTREIVRPRQEAMFLCKEFTTRSLPDIAKRFGGMDHTTVMHAVKRIKSLVRDDSTVRADIDSLRQQLTSRRGPSSSD